MSIAEYYDQRAKYQLLPYDEDWDTVIEKFSKVINTRLRCIFGDKKLRILDCTCGIGTQAIALSKLGHEVYASDISPEMVKHAEKYSNERNFSPIFFVQDVREPFDEKFKNYFDVVVSLNNSLIFVSNDENGDKHLENSFKNFNKILKPTGIIMLSLRPYDEYLKNKPLEPPRRNWKFREIQGETVRFRQVYNWLDDNKHYICDTYYDFLQADGSIKTTSETVKVRAWREEEIKSTLGISGFNNTHIEIIEDTTGHYREKWFYAFKTGS